jgi:competence protein ComEC
MVAMVTAGIAVLTGVILACFQTQSIDIYWLSLLPVCLFFIFFNPSLRFLWLLVASFLYASLHIYLQIEQRPATAIVNKKITLTGKVLNIPSYRASYRGKSARFVFKPQQIDQFPRLPEQIRLSWNTPPDNLKAGQQWQLRVKFKPAHGFQNPGGFDYERWLFVKGIQATGYVVNDANNRLLGENSFSINRLRQDINRWIGRHCQDCRYSGLLQALSTGYRGDISTKQRSLFQNTGTAHLIAISGLHIGIIAAFVFFLTHRMWNMQFYKTRLSRSDFCWTLSWIVVLMYSLLSGFELPAQRAFLMFSVLGLMNFLRLPLNLLNSVMATLVAVLIFSPMAVLSESFWLTLCAMGIILFGGFLLQHEHSRWRQLLTIQLLFSLLFIPLTLIIFGQIQSASFLANLLAVPLVSLVVVPVNFILLSLFWLPDSWLSLAYTLMDGLIGLLVDYLHLLLKLGLQAIELDVVNIWRLVLLLIWLFLLLLPQGILRIRGWLMLLPVVFAWPSSRGNGELLALTVLDVGTGNAVVLQTREHSLIYDFGPGNRSGFSVGEWVIQPFLRYQGISQVDQIIISHNDQDHSGGLYSVVKNFKQVPVLSGTPESVRQRFPELQSIRDCHDIKPWRWDGVDFEFLMTEKDTTKSDNNRSCVLRISLNDQHILLTGDIESVQERLLLNSFGEKLKADILLVPHHGSLSSSTPEFIDSVSSRHVIFSTGYLNHWRFPKPEILRRYQKTDAHLYRTDQDGAIQVYCSSSNCEVEKIRQLYPRIWY